ncbi:MAG: hypothetical protein KC656_35240, partial [Myxococcales bacterium]|nr:hypothetical protein [Myxococcales bacterium]
ADLVCAAIANEPSERLPSVEAFRDRLRTIVEHRGARALVEQAHASLEALEAEAAGASDRIALYTYFGACRFGFLEALRAWPESTEATEGLQRAVRCMLELELEAGDVRAAEVLLAQLPASGPDLEARLDGLRADRDAEATRRARLEDDADPRIGQRTRLFAVAVFAAYWTLTPVLIGLSGWEASHPRDAGLALVTLGLVVGFLLWARESLLATPVNRVSGAALVLGTLTEVAVHVLVGITGGTLHLAHTVEMLAFALLAWSACVTVPGVWPTAVGFSLAALGMAFLPGWETAFLSAGSFVLLVNVLVLWVPGLPTEPTYRRS